jgi:hypothetical protein
LVLITLVGAALRWFFSGHLPMLSTCSGLEHMTTAYRLAELDWYGPFQAAYPLAIQALAAPFMVFFGQSPVVYTSVVFVLSVVMIPALFLSGRLLWGRPLEGLLAAAGAALFPPFLLFSRSGSLALPYASLGAMAIALILLWQRSRDKRLLAAWLAILLVLLQTRLEAALFIVPVGVLLGLSGIKELFRDRASRTLAIAGLLLAIPYLATKITELFQPDLMGNAPVWFMVLLVLGVGGGWAVAMTGCGMAAQRNQLASWLYSALGLSALGWAIAMALTMDWSLFWQATTSGRIDSRASYLALGILPLEPMLTPALVTLAVIVAGLGLLESAERRNWARLCAWFLPLLAASQFKQTGELPFEGVRTALPAIPPMLLLAARGGAMLTDHVKTISPGYLRGLLFGLLGVGLVVSWIPPWQACQDTQFAPQAEFRFAHRVVETLPDNAILMVPDVEVMVSFERQGEPDRLVDLAGLFRLESLFNSVLGERRSGITLLTVSKESSRLIERDSSRPYYFVTGLTCYRRGDRNGVWPVCGDIPQRLEGKLVFSTNVPERIYSGDFVRDIFFGNDQKVLALFKLD